MARLIAVTVIAVWIVWPASQGAAYEEMAQVNGGTIAGTVTLVGGKPIPKGFNLITFPDPVYCGRISTGTGWRILEEFNVSPEGGLKDVVVMLAEVTRGKPFAFTPPTIEARDCRFLPFVTVVRDEYDVKVVNMDPVMHDIQAYETSNLGPRVLFNVPLPMNPHHPRSGVGAEYHKHIAGEPMIQKIRMTRDRRIFVMQCGFHAYMESWGLAIEHPYYAITGSDGSFSLAEVPPGDYVLTAWHPQTGPALKQHITVKAGEAAAASFEFQAPMGRRSVHEIVENPHFGMEALGRSIEIRPTLELQRP